MERYFGNAYREDPGIPHSGPDPSYGLELPSSPFAPGTALTCCNSPPSTTISFLSLPLQGSNKIVVSPRVDKDGMKQGAWSAEEDKKLIDYISRYRIWNWGYVAKFSGLSRNGKSCRLRWVNYLNPDIKRGNITKEEEKIIVDMYAEMGSRWSTIAKRLPGRTDNEIKNYWYTRLKKRSNENPTQRIDPHTVEIRTVEGSVRNSEASNSPASINILSSATSSKASNSLASINLPMNPYVAMDELSDSSTGYARGVDDIQEINEASTDNSLLQSIGDFQDFWTDPYFTGNIYTENNQQEAYVQEWYQEPLCSYGLFIDDYWLNDYLPDVASMVGAEMPNIYLP